MPFQQHRGVTVYTFLVSKGSDTLHEVNWLLTQQGRLKQIVDRKNSVVVERFHENDQEKKKVYI